MRRIATQDEETLSLLAREHVADDDVEIVRLDVVRRGAGYPRVYARDAPDARILGGPT